jgi:DNA-directed RNA polymerase specialized sigma24 family protein
LLPRYELAMPAVWLPINWRVGARLPGNDGEAEDVVQETYVRAFTQARSSAAGATGRASVSVIPAR